MRKTIPEYKCHTYLKGMRALFVFCLLLYVGQSSPAGAQADLFGRRAGGASHAGQRTRPAPHPAVFSSHPISLHNSGSFDDTLGAMFAQAPVNYVYAPRAAPANKAKIELKNAPFDEALNTILRAYPARPPMQPHLAGNVLSLMQNDAPGQKPSPKARLVTLRLKDVKLSDALNALFAALGTEHAPVDNLEGRVTLTMRAAPHARVLDALMKQSPRPLTLLERDNALIIRRK